MEFRHTRRLAACAEQIKFALEINPTHEKANELLQGLNFLQDAEYLYFLDEKLVDLSGPEPIYLILTPQPTATYTPIPLDTPISQITPTPENTVTSTTAPTATQAPTLTDLPSTSSPTDPPASPTESASQNTDRSPTIFILFGTVLVLVFLIGLAVRRKK